MRLNIYKVNKSLPDYLIYDSLQCNRIWDITPGIYKFSKSITVKYSTLNEVFSAIENKDIQLDVSDIVELLPDENTINEELSNEIKEQCNFLIFTYLGTVQIAIDSETVFAELSVKEIANLIM